MISHRPHSSQTTWHLPPRHALRVASSVVATLALCTTALTSAAVPASAAKPPRTVTHVDQLVTSSSPTVSTARAGTGPLMGRDGVAALAPATGFARGTTGGAAGAVYHVTSSEDSLTSPAPGTLRYGLRPGGPRWIVFDTDMTITFRGPMLVPSDTTIDGRGRNVVLTGHGVAGLRIYDATNVIIESVSMRDFGDIALTVANDPSDAIEVKRSSSVWIDHNTLSHAADKLVAIEDGGRGVTVSWNRFYDQEQVVQVGALSTAVNDVATTVTFHHNFFDRVGYRLPLVLYAKAHVYNNFMYAWNVSGVRSERLGQVYLEGNVFQQLTSRKAALVDPAQICNDAGTFCDPRAGFLADVDNYVSGKAVILSSGTAQVFTPRLAYAYTAEAATPALGARIAAGAGVPAVTGATSPTPATPPTSPAAPVTTKAPTTHVSAPATVRVTRPLPVARVLASRYGVRWSRSARAHYYVVRITTKGHRNARTFRTRRQALSVHRVSRVTVYAMNSAGASGGRSVSR